MVKQKILITGVDGYLGFPLALYLLSRKHQVLGIDNLSRRERVQEVGAQSAIPIADPFERFVAIRQRYSQYQFKLADLRKESEVNAIFQEFEPDTCIHLGEIPSAPYSMIDAQHCIETMMNNVIGTLNILYAMHKYAPDCHLLKLGTMGEYGTPNMDIPEGFFEIEYKGRKDTLPFPRQAGSWYHWTKVHDSNNIMFACKIWGLRSTDIMQGVVHGITTKEMQDDDRLLTRFDFDEIWGTALNRFCAQAIIGHELTPYGAGGQTRGYIALRDSIQCFGIVIENPPKPGEYRVLNQFEETHNINELAEHVASIADELGLKTRIKSIGNPRVEMEKHYYNPAHEGLFNLGFKPTYTLDDELRLTLFKLMDFKDRIEEKKNRILPTVYWRK